MSPIVKHMPLPRAVIVSIVAIALPATTMAASGRIGSSVTLNLRSDAPGFRGHVTSSSPTCERHRHVVVKKQRPGSDVPVAEARTGDNGHYRASFGIGPATYYAQVRGENRGANELPCKGDRSSTITIAEGGPAGRMRLGP